MTLPAARNFDDLSPQLQKRIQRECIGNVHVYIKRVSSGWQVISIHPQLDPSGMKRQDLTDRGFALVVGIGGTK
jgi:hypothetical protein